MKMVKSSFFSRSKCWMENFIFSYNKEQFISGSWSRGDSWSYKNKKYLCSDFSRCWSKKKIESRNIK